MDKEQKKLDEKFMRRCIELADEAGKTGDLPFGSVVVLDGEIIGEGSNMLQQGVQIDAHAERIALVAAQKKLGQRTLPECTVYSNVEPCPMCSFPIRELHIKRVVYGLKSPVMGGHSRFGVLQDEGLHAKIPGYFGEPPEIVAGVLKDEAAASWKKYAPEIWSDFSSKSILI